MRGKKVALDPDYKTLLDFTENKTDFRSKKRRINRKYQNIVGVPHPFVKWVGGKRQLLRQFNPFFPKQFGKYIEPFVGGGAVFFYLLPKSTVLIDRNAELINCYRVIQTDVENLIELLKQHQNNDKYYYKIRNADRNPREFSQWSAVERASRTIYLNRCCFNGLYRVNSKGEFNAPFGKYKNPKFCDEVNLRAVNRVLQGVTLHKAGFEKCTEIADEGDLVYFDPPYQPLTETANFTGYTKEGFGDEMQTRLRDIYKELDKRGCKVMLSNSYSQFILDLYNEFKIITVDAKRAINRDGDKRGEIKEVLVVNF